MAIEITKSALKHGYTATDIEWAMFHPIKVVQEFEKPTESRAGYRVDAWVGPCRANGELIEVFAELRPPRLLVIFHVMKARSTTLQRMEADND